MSDSEHTTDGNGGGPQVTQDGHLLAIETQLGKDALLLTAVDGTETMSRGFVYTIDMLTRASGDEVRSLLGKPVTLWLRNESETVRRPLHGHIRHLTRLTVDARGYRRWQAEVVPFMWFLTRSVDCRIFQDLTIPEIVRKVFDEHELTNYEFRLHDQYPKHVFCVQYRESAFAFVSRLMEHAGIFYWFEHSEDRHVLVLADNNRAAKFTEPRQAVMSLRPDLGQIQDLVHDFTFRTGNWALNDFDFEVPTKNLRTHEPTVLDVPPMKRFEIFDYPGSYTVPGEGKKLTQMRIQEEEARHHKVSGSGSCVGFDAGKRFTLTPDRPMNGDKQSNYLLTEVRHSARDSNYFATEAEPATYSNRFACIPVETPFRPERLTDKPIVQGPQTATVVGPAGENIHTDQYGRVRLLFHWDRRGKRDEHASCWIRVSQVSAGSRWGSLAIPHVGQEVMVDFLEGDPDRPIVTGHVHNGDNMPPLNLPRDKDKTIMRDHGDNKLIMHGKASYQWLSVVSPRAVNLVAMRSTAKPLSADVTIDGVGFDPSQDDTGFGWLKKLWDELNGKVQTTTAPPPDSSASFSVDPSGDNAAYQASVNMLTEGEINSLSVSNTNAWVGHDMNTWVRGNMKQEVVGKTDTISHGDTTNTYHSQVTDNFDTLHEENTTMHNEFCGIHSEFTGIHTELTGYHGEINGIHEESTGIHISLKDLCVREYTFADIATFAMKILNTDLDLDQATLKLIL
jgi:type VI secretion system secreted protein VgrG